MEMERSSRKAHRLLIQLEPLEQRRDLLALLCYDGFQFGNAGFWRHAPILRLLRKPGEIVAMKVGWPTRATKLPRIAASVSVRQNSHIWNSRAVYAKPTNLS